MCVDMKNMSIHLAIHPQQQLLQNIRQQQKSPLCEYGANVHSD